MSDERGASARSPGGAHVMTRPGQASDRERVLLLECRLEQMRATLEAARKDADDARMETADISAREADHVRRFALLHEELAEARIRIAELHRALERSESLREQLAGHLFEGGTREDAEELLRLRRAALGEEQRALRADRTVQRLRDRVDELVTSRELLLTRIAQWQQLIRKGEPDATDLSEFLADLRREILDLEHRGVESDAREALLRRRLSRAGIDPELDPEEADEETAAEPPSSTVPALVGFVSQGPRPAVSGADNGAGAADGSLDEPLDEALDEALDPDEATATEPSTARGGADEAGVRTPSAQGDAPADTARVATDALRPDARGAGADGGSGHGDDAEVAERAAAVALTPGVETGDDGSRDEAADEAREADEPRPRRADGVAPTPTRFAAASPRSEALLAELREMSAPALQTDLLLRLGRSGDAGAVGGVSVWTGSSEPSVRAAAYEALGRLLERTPQAFEPHVRTGLADPDGRVRRRVVLAMASARGLPVASLLDPLRQDPDPQVRRVVRQVLRQSRSGAGRAEPEPRGPRTPRSLANRPSRTAP